MPPIYQTPLLGTLKLDRRPGRLLDHLQYSLPRRQPTYPPPPPPHIMRN